MRAQGPVPTVLLLLATIVTAQAQMGSPGGGETQAIALHPTNPQIIYVGAAKGLCKTTSGGKDDWPSTGLASLSPRTIAIDPKTPDTVYAGTFRSGVYKTTNGGGSDLPPRTSPPSKLDLGPLEVHSPEQNRVLVTWGVWPPAPEADRPRRCEAVSGCTPFATSRLAPLLPTTCRRSLH